MAKIDRLSGCSDWIGLSFVERERTPRQLMELGIRLHLAGLSLSNTVRNAVDPEINKILYVWLYSTTTTALAERFLRELTEKHDLNDAVLLVNGEKHLQTALRRSGLRFQYGKYGNRNAAKRVSVR